MGNAASPDASPIGRAGQRREPAAAAAQPSVSYSSSTAWPGPSITFWGIMSQPLKLVLLGDSGVGKTALSERFNNGSFPEQHNPTVGASFAAKTVSTPEKEVKLQIWDIAGMERFRALYPIYQRGAHAIFYLYDISKRESFQNVSYRWEKETNMARDENHPTVLFLIGTKCDKPSDERQISPAEGEELARRIGAEFFEISSRSNVNVEEVFLAAAVKASLAFPLDQRVVDMDVVK